MTNDEHKQNALADAINAAQLVHSLRALAGEVEGLMRGSIRDASDAGVSRAIIAEGVALTPGRVSQIVLSEPRRAADAHRRLYNISEWPGDALREHRKSFTGRMTYPPYDRRRAMPSETVTAPDGTVFTLTGTVAGRAFEEQRTWRVERASTKTLHGYLHLISEAGEELEFGYTDEYNDPMVPEGPDWGELVRERLSSWPDRRV